MIRQQIPVEQLKIDSIQSRDQSWSGDGDDQQLIDSIKVHGLMQDLIVRPIDNRPDTDGNGGNNESFAIVAGSRRYQAAMNAGYETIPCKVIEADTIKAAWTSLAENTDRKNLSEQEVSEQLKLIYELVRPHSEPETCPECGTAVDGEMSLYSHYGQTECTPVSTVQADAGRDVRIADGDRFPTDRDAKRYLADRFLGRTDDGAIKLINGHLRTAELPPIVQALFKPPAKRSAAETTGLENYGIDGQAVLGNGEGRSGTSREIVSLFDTVESEFDDAAINPTDAVLEAVGSLRRDEMSEQELRRTLREFRSELIADVDASLSAAEQQTRYVETLEKQVAELRSTHEEIDPVRPFKRVDVLGPETQRHSRWHARVKTARDVSGHGELVRKLYQERLETLADEQGWE